MLCCPLSRKSSYARTYSGGPRRKDFSGVPTAPSRKGISVGVALGPMRAEDIGKPTLILDLDGATTRFISPL